MGSGDSSEYSHPHVCEEGSKLVSLTSLPDVEPMIRSASHHDERVLLQEMTNCARPCSCQFCHKRFANEERLGNHLKSHGAEDLKPKQCNVCLKRFLNNSALGSHLRTHNGQGLAMECSICKESYSSRDGLKKHVLSHSRDGSFPCPYCRKVFMGYLPIRKHISKTHKNSGVQCSLCNQICPDRQIYKKHMLRHSTEKEFSCSHCEKQFKRNDKLKEHVKRMHDCLPLELNQDSKKREKKKLVKQMSSEIIIERKLHDLNARYTFKCQPCLLGFKRRGMLVNHIAKYHPNITPDEVPELNLPIIKATRDFFCHVCEKVYKSNAKRKAHILKFHPGALKNDHLEVKPFDQLVGTVIKTPEHCQWCHKQYATNAKLLQHLRSQHSDKSYPELRKKGKSQVEDIKSINFDSSLSMNQNSLGGENQPSQLNGETSRDKEFIQVESGVQISTAETLNVADAKVCLESFLTEDDDDLILAECLMKLHANLSSLEVSSAEIVRDGLLEVEAGGSEMSSAAATCDETCAVERMQEETSLITEDVDVIMAEWLMDLHTETPIFQNSLSVMNTTVEPVNENENENEENFQLSSVLAICSNVFLNDDPTYHPFEVHSAQNMTQLEPVEPVYSPYPPH